MRKSRARVATGVVACFISLLLLTGTLAAAGLGTKPEAINGVLDLTDWNWGEDGIISLDGQWEFYWQQLLTPEDFKGATPLTQRHHMSVPRAWSNSLLDGEKLTGDGYATYRLLIRTSAKQILGLKIPRIFTAYTLWADGQLLASSGKVGKDKDQMTPQYRPTVKFIKPETNTVELVMQVSNFRHRSGGILESLRLGPETAINALRVNGVALELFLFGSLFIIGFYHFGLFIFRSQDRSTLYFGIYCLLIAIRTLLVGEIYLIYLFPHFSWELAHKLQTLAFYLGVPLVFSFLKALFPKDVSTKLTGLIQIFGIAFGLLVLLTPAKVFTQFNPIYQIFTLVISIPYALFILASTCYKKREGAFLIGLGAAILILCVINDIVYLSIALADSNAHFLRNFVTRGDRSSLGLLILVFSQSLVLAKEFSASFRNLEQVTNELSTNLERLESEKRLRLLEEALRNGAKSMTATLKSEEVLSRLLVNLSQNVGFSKAAVFLKSQENFDVVATFGFDDTNTGERYGLDDHWHGLLSSREPFIIGTDDSLSGLPLLSPGHGHWIGIPLVFEDSVLGLLALAKHEPGLYKASEMEIILSFAEQAAIAVENAREFDRVHQMATYDGLTGLFSRTRFMELATQRYKEALTEGQPLTVFMLDLDHFKTINDTYGHSAGDYVLRVIAERCKDALGEGDIAGRYGGEEFIILTSRQDTDMGERIRKGIEQIPVTLRDQGPIRVTASLGAAEIRNEAAASSDQTGDCGQLDPDHGLTLLIQQADAALYQAKKSGRNRVVQLSLEWI